MEKKKTDDKIRKKKKFLTNTHAHTHAERKI